MKAPKKLLPYLLAIGIGISAAGCASHIKSVSMNIAMKHQDSYKKHLSRYADDVKKLRDNEYVLPDSVYNTFTRIVIGGVPTGLHVNYAILSLGSRKQYSNELEKQGYGDFEIGSFYTMMTRSNSTLIPKRLLEHKKFDEVLTHERFHEEQNKLSFFEKRKIKKTYKQLKKDFECANFLVKNEHFKTPVDSAIHSDWQEFLPYLNDGMFHSVMDTVLVRRHPETYNLYQKLKKKVNSLSSSEL